MIRRVCTVGMAISCFGVVASDAAGATLTLAVPRHVQKGKIYTIAINGSFKRSEVRGQAYLIAAIQFSGKPCKRTALGENGAAPQFYFENPKQGPTAGAGIYERHSPFTRRDSFRAGVLGSRHVCAYLYPRFVGPTDDTTPIATADTAYRVLRR